MEALRKKLIGEFQTSNAHAEAINRIENMVFRGMPSDQPENVRSSDLLNKFTEAENPTQVMNILAYATNTARSSSEINEKHVALENGNFSLVQDTHRQMFQRIVKQLPCNRFLLVPLTLGIKDFSGKWTLYSSLIIKTKTRGDDICWIDMVGRVYQSFHKFLDENKLPFSVLCYPTEGAIQFDSNGRIEVEFKLVGVKNTLTAAADVLFTTFGLFGAFVVPFQVVTLATGGYFTVRGGMELMDAANHGQSVNPLKNAEAALNWFQVAANVAFIGLVGIQKVSLLDELCSVIQISRTATHIQVGINTAFTAARIFSMLHSWDQMTLDDQVSLASAMCFMYREVISLDNGYRILQNVRIDALRKTFHEFVGENFNLEKFKVFIKNITNTFETLLFLLAEILKANIQVKVDEDFATIRFFGHRFSFPNLLGLTTDDIVKILQVVKALNDNWLDLFFILRKSFGDAPIIRMIAHRANELDGDYGAAANQFLRLFELIRNIRENSLVALNEANMELIIGAGNTFTLCSAFEIFGGAVNFAQSIPLLRALLELSPEEATKLNCLRARLGTGEQQLFRELRLQAVDGREALEAIRAVLRNENGDGAPFEAIEVD